MIDTSQFSEDVAFLIKGQEKKGFRVLLDCKRASGEWRAEVWQFSMVNWCQRSKAVHQNLLTALLEAIHESDKWSYAA